MTLYVIDNRKRGAGGKIQRGKTYYTSRDEAEFFLALQERYLTHYFFWIDEIEEARDGPEKSCPGNCGVKISTLTNSTTGDNKDGM